MYKFITLLTIPWAWEFIFTGNLTKIALTYLILYALLMPILIFII